MQTYFSEPYYLNVAVDVLNPTEVDVATGLKVSAFAEQSPLLPSQKIDDEFSSHRTLAPLHEVRGGYAGQRDCTPEVRAEMDYYARTRDLEVGSARTAQLEEIVSRMVEGTGVESYRVVIMRKGKEPEAFVMPEGTIFINESAINAAGTLDGVGAILAHEVSHLINKTYEKRQASDFGGIEVGWLHEIVGDQMMVFLLEKAGLNSLSLARIIETLGGKAVSRDFTHQTGLARASENVGLHWSLHFTTSDMEETPLGALRSEVIRRTNLEILKDLAEEMKFAEMGEAFALLHPRDLPAAYVMLQSKEVYSYGISQPELKKKKEEKFRAVDRFFELAKERLVAAGFSQAESNLFSLLYFDPNRSERHYPTWLFPSSPAEVSAFSEAITGFFSEGKYFPMERALFGRSTYRNYLDNLCEILSVALYDPAGIKLEQGIPVNHEQFYDLITKVSQITTRSVIERIVLGYINVAFLAQAGSRPANMEAVRDFLQGLAAAGIHFNLGQIPRSYQMDEVVVMPDKRITISKENREKVLALIREIFSPQVTEKEIDNFLYRCIEDRREEMITNFVDDLRISCDTRGMNNEERAVLLRNIFEKIDRQYFYTPANLRAQFLSVEINGELVPLDKQSESLRDTNNLIFRFCLKELLAFTVFDRDCPEFYALMRQAMDTAGFPVSESNLPLMVALIEPFFTEPFFTGRLSVSLPKEIGFAMQATKGLVKIENMDEFSRLPWIEAWRQRKRRLEVETFGDLLTFARVEAQTFFRNSHADIYDDSLRSVMLGREIRLAFERLAERGVRPEEQTDLYEFVRDFFPQSPERDEVLREINRRYLLSPEIDLASKIEHLTRNLENIGYEGVRLVAEQITTLDDYRQFHQRMGKVLERYLEGGSAVLKTAVAENVASWLGHGFRMVFKTCDESNTEQASTSIAEKWIRAYCNEDSLIHCYDERTGKFIINARGREIFRSVGDIFSILHGLGRLERTAVSFELLIGKEGAFVDPYGRQQLGEVLTEALALKPGFVAEVLQEACRTADAKWLVFPIAQLTSPLLFRALKVEGINTDRLLEEELELDGERVKVGTVFTREKLSQVLRSSTRELVLFGRQYLAYPDSPLSQLAAESDRGYQRTKAWLLETFRPKDFGGEKKPSGPEALENANTEAIIRGVESAGALGVRSLQLSDQLHHFSPEVSRRLKNCFDANPGIDKVLFWENMLKLMEDEPKLRPFIEEQLVSVGRRLGAGSLFTTYEATLRTADGTEEIVLKMLNPNAVAFVLETGSLAMEVLEGVEQTSRGQDRRFAVMGKTLVGLAQEWCLRDINDPNFETDDDLFRQTVEMFGQVEREVTYYVPERRLTSYWLKAERKAPGETLNQVLKDPEVAPEEKRKLVASLERFFYFQLRHPVEDEEGKRIYLVHSDPHVGNYIVDFGSEGVRVAVIDRNMYLRLEKEDVAVCEALIAGDGLTFLRLLLERTLVANKITNITERGRIIADISTSVIREGLRQKVKGGQDVFGLLNLVMGKLVQYHVEVPLELRLMIRNIVALKELKRRYSV